MLLPQHFLLGLPVTVEAAQLFVGGAQVRQKVERLVEVLLAERLVLDELVVMMSFDVAAPAEVPETVDSGLTAETRIVSITT